MSKTVTDHTHVHDYSSDTSQNEKNTWRVIIITLVMMIAEIAGGIHFGSMSLLADGWHMGTHAAALGITAFAYVYARKHSKSSRYSFGTGKVGSLGGFASAIGLFCVSAVMITESVARFIHPVEIHYSEAILIAVIGLIVNMVCAFLLRDSGHHHHHHGDECHGHHHHGHDHNLKAAYLHVLADALTSVAAIVALLIGKYFGGAFLDPLIGIAGAVIIGKWSIGLIKETSKLLLDANADEHLLKEITQLIEDHSNDRVTDLHVWKISESATSMIISICSDNPKSTNEYKALIAAAHNIQHITVEVVGDGR